MPVLQYVHLDVFTNRPFTGNQLAVFLDAAEIDERWMQRNANEMAFTETTFVFPPKVSGTDARVRIFTPSRELPMAGSPTIGTTYRQPVTSFDDWSTQTAGCTVLRLRTMESANCDVHGLERHHD